MLSVYSKYADIKDLTSEYGSLHPDIKAQYQSSLYRRNFDIDGAEKKYDIKAHQNLRCFKTFEIEAH